MKSPIDKSKEYKYIIGQCGMGRCAGCKFSVAIEQSERIVYCKVNDGAIEKWECCIAYQPKEAE